MAYWVLPSQEQLDELMMLTLPQRGEQLHGMTPSRRIAYGVALAKAEDVPPHRVMDRFDSWQQLYLDSLQVGEAQS